jgi:anti-sigma-K factor RskA
MTTEPDRIARAGNYVLGLMDDAERDRAERDLEIDPAFRDAVIDIAERMHMFDMAAQPEDTSDGSWKAIAARIADMPQMRPAFETGDRPAQAAELETIGANRKDSAPAIASFSPRRLAAFMAAGLLIAFAGGYLTGRGWLF